MKSEWPKILFEDGPLTILDGDRGKNYPSQNEFYKFGHCLFLNTGNVTNNGFEFTNCAFITEQKDAALRKGKLNRGDVVLTTRGTVGNVGYFNENVPFQNVRINSGMVILRADNIKLSNNFLYFFVRSNLFKEQVKKLQSGSAQPQLPIKDMKRVLMPLPALKTQLEICNIIGALDDRITLLRETNTTLEAIAQALFKSWFIDFDPVHAKMQGQAPQGMDEATAALFPDSFEESELGPIPKGWKVGVVSDLGEVICGKTPPTSNPENYGQDVPFITIPDMHNNLVITNTVRSLSKLGANSQNKKYLPEGSICVSCIATAGLVSRVTRPSQTNQQINSVIPYTKWGKSFPLFLLRRIGDSVRAAGSGGSVFHNLNKSGFEKINVLLTSCSLTKIFDELIEPIIEKIESNQNHIQNLESIRDELLPRLISGQISVTSIKKEFNA